MVFIVQAAGIDKVRVLQPQLRRLFIHQLRIRRLGARHIDGQRLGRLRAGGQDRAVYQIEHRHLFSVHKACQRRIRKIQGVNDLLRHGERIVPVFDLLARDQRRHDLRHRGGIDARVRVFLRNDRVALRVDQQHALAVDLKIERPRRVVLLRVGVGLCLRRRLRFLLRLDRLHFRIRMRFRLRRIRLRLVRFRHCGRRGELRLRLLLNRLLRRGRRALLHQRRQRRDVQQHKHARHHQHDHRDQRRRGRGVFLFRRILPVHGSILLFLYFCNIIPHFARCVKW